MIASKRKPSANWVVSVSGPDGKTSRLLTRATGSITIGRDPTCDFPVPSPTVSRKHVRIEVVGETIRLTDTSANGTLVGGDLVKRKSVALALGTPVQIGPYQLRVSEPGLRATTDGPRRSAVPAATGTGVPSGGDQNGDRETGASDITDRVFPAPKVETPSFKERVLVSTY